MPFVWKEAKEDRLIKGLAEFCQTQPSFTLYTKGFSCFPPRVIFIAIEQNEDLASLQRQLVRFCRLEFNLLNANYREQPFHPHMTIAFRDLKKDKFEEAWREFENKHLYLEFSVATLALLKHNGHEWNVLFSCLLEKITD